MGRLHLLFEMEDFHGWNLHGALDDFTFGLKNRNVLKRLAAVCDRNWERWLSKLYHVLSRAEVRYFDHDHLDDAWTWMRAA